MIYLYLYFILFFLYGTLFLRNQVLGTVFLK